MSLVADIETSPRQRSGNYQITRFNALRHGALSRYTILPWEDEDEYRSLLEALVAEHGPHGPTEEHFVEELAGIIWRKRRLRLGEAAAHHRALRRTTEKNPGNVRPITRISRPTRYWWLRPRLRPGACALWRAPC
jgi:hypothetical protein